MKSGRSLLLEKAIIVLMAFLVVQARAGEASVGQKSSANTYLSLEGEHGAPQTEARDRFDCSDKIFSVAELKHYPRGKHQLTVRWVDPHQTTRETTSYPFHIQRDSTRIWAWLSLSRGAGAGILQWIDPTAGLEEFIGRWTMQMEIDGKTIAESNFEVSC